MTNNSKKCNGYESMFTFLSDEDFATHLEVCEACKSEHVRMENLSNLLLLAKPRFKKERKMTKVLATASLFFMIAMSIPVCTYGIQELESHVIQNSMTAEDFGFPVDEYGLIYFE